MWKSLITILCASGTVLAYHEPQSVVAPPLTNRTRIGKPNGIIRRFTCPDGFVRLRRNCFYFSAGTANWQNAHFYCKDRNATLATLPKKNMDKRLRNFLAGPQMKQLERWIGARYNWGKMTWEWGTTGDEISYEGFSKIRSEKEQIHKWHCAAMNPERNFRWAVRSCFDEKYYICQTLAARLKCNVPTQQVCPSLTVSEVKGARKLRRRQRRRRIDNSSNRNGNGTTSTRNLFGKNHVKPFYRGSWRTTRKSQSTWNNGVGVGMRPPVPSTKWAPGAKYSDRLQLVKGKGLNDPDQRVSPSKTPPAIDNHLDAEPSKISSEEFVGSPRFGPRTLSSGPENMLNQLGGQQSNLVLEDKILFKD